jgi:hypothetical protein
LAYQILVQRRPEDLCETYDEAKSRWSRNYAATTTDSTRKLVHMKKNIILLLTFVAMTSVGCEHPSNDEVRVVQAQPVTLMKTYRDCSLENLSESFRQVAGDTFDRLQSLESNELEGKIFYQPAEQEAERAVLKTQRIASRPDEIKLAELMSTYLLNTDLYRHTTILVNRTKNIEAEDPEIVRQVYREHPGLKLPSSAYYIQQLSKAKEDQQQSKTIIAACVSAPKESEIRNVN